jgi:cell division protein FtsZ
MVFNFKQEEPSIIKVIGVGGGGSNAVTHMYKQGIVGVDFAICNTDIQSMDLSPVPVRIQLGEGVSQGLGAGSQPQRGKQACLESIEGIKQYLGTSTKMLFITAGMGGGTGTGAAPIIAKTAQEMGVLTVAIVTLPFTFEGRKRVTQGYEGLEDLKKNVDTIIVISNDKLRAIYGNMSVSNAFAQADNILTTAAKGIAEIITVPGYVNVDFEDVNTVMRGSGVAIMGIGIAEGDTRALKAVDSALSSPLLEDNNIQGAKQILVNITSGTKEVTMDEIVSITEFVQEEAGENANLIWGNCYDDTLGDKIAVTVIATGFESHTANPLKEVKNDGKIMVSLDEEPRVEKKPDFFGFGFDNTEGGKSSGNTIEFDANRYSKPQPRPVYTAPQPVQEPAFRPEDRERFEEERRRRMMQEQNRRERLRSGINTVKLNNPQTIIEMENEPAYLRRGVKLDTFAHSSERPNSNWSIDENDELRGNSNSYLDPQVD